MIGHIDKPSAGSIIYSPDFDCTGWVYSETGIQSIKIFIDDCEVGDAECGLSRNDVKNAFSHYSGIEKSGFGFSKNLPIVKGSHKLKVIVYEKNGNKKCLGEVAFKYTRKNFYNTKVFPSFTHLVRKYIGQDALDSRNIISFRYLQGEGIEIGALHNPLPISNRAQVKYVDKLPLVELQKLYSDLNPNQMVKIDLIDNGEMLLKIADNSLDFIIANHFLEHCENPIGTIRNHLKKIQTGGILFYTIPEKTYTFDKERSLTDFNHFIEDDSHDPAISKKNHFHEWVTLVEKKHDINEIDHRISVLMAMNYSIHYHVWDVNTILIFWCKTNEYLKNPFSILHFEQNKNEIITVLQKK
jgi:hypothetical protein